VWKQESGKWQLLGEVMSPLAEQGQ
jgi:hypothetical protein